MRFRRKLKLRRKLKESPQQGTRVARFLRSFATLRGKVRQSFNPIYRTCPAELVVERKSLSSLTDLGPAPTPGTLDYLINVESLKIGRMIAMAMKPTTDPMMMIMIGSIMAVTVLIVSRSCLA